MADLLKRLSNNAKHSFALDSDPDEHSALPLLPTDVPSSAIQRVNKNADILTFDRLLAELV